MVDNRIEKTPDKILGGVSLKNSFVTPIPKTNTPKKHSRKPRGWIRGKKIYGKTYFYYCWAERNAAGDYPEKSEYLGTAEHIRYCVKGK